jgi:hypothetical protein
MQGSFTSGGVAFDWAVQRGPGSPPSWILVIVAGDISIARRYEDEMAHREAESEARKAAGAIVKLIEQWTG